MKHYEYELLKVWSYHRNTHGHESWPEYTEACFDLWQVKSALKSDEYNIWWNRILGI